MGVIAFIQKNKITREWVSYTVIASFIPVICRIFASSLSSADMYDNFDMLYAGLGLNLAGLNIMIGKTEPIKSKMTDCSIFLILIIGLILGILYSNQHVKVSDTVKTVAIVFSNLFAFASLALSFFTNKYIN